MPIRRRVVGRLVALGVGGALAVGMLEAALAFFPRLSEPDSFRWEQRWRATRHLISPTAGSLFAHSPELGWEPRAGARQDGITINGAGLRAWREYDPEPPPGVRRVLAVGDSFTYGLNLRDDQTMPARLEAELNRRGRWEVLNLGVPGYGTDQQWLRLERRGFRYRADVVVLGFFENDARRNAMSFRDYAKPRFALEDGRLALRNVPVPAPEELLARPPNPRPCRLRLACAAGLVADGLAFDHGLIAPEWTEAGQVTLAILDAMREAVVARGMQFVLMTIPRRVRPEPRPTEVLLVRWAERTGTPLVNTREAYLALPEPEHARLYAGHWTPHGAAVTARLLAERLAERTPATR